MMPRPANWPALVRLVREISTTGKQRGQQTAVDAKVKDTTQITEADRDAVDQSGIKRTFLLIHTPVPLPYIDFQRISRLTV